MTYLTLFLASKFSITIPYLAPRAFGGHNKDLGPNTPLRSQAAAPPVFLLIITLIPICAAIYISSTRYSDFRHHGFDILFGALMGFVCAWFAFRWYHLPIRRGAGYAWGARSPSRAFGIGIGVGSYAGGEESDVEKSRKNPDLERGVVATSSRTGENIEMHNVPETATFSGATEASGIRGS
jgi:PAP2 superfamily